MYVFNWRPLSSRSRVGTISSGGDESSACKEPSDQAAVGPYEDLGVGRDVGIQVSSTVHRDAISARYAASLLQFRNASGRTAPPTQFDCPPRQRNEELTTVSAGQVGT